MIATQNGRLTLDQPRAIRGVTFLQNGQSFESWLPVGSWVVAGECNLNVGRGSSETRRAVILKATGAGSWGTWYIGLTVAKELGIVA